jgi:hypothetical protein
MRSSVVRTVVRGSGFQAIDVSGLMVDPDSGQAATPTP